jgi:hypothetical protein
MKDLPDSADRLVVRTDFSDEAAWARTRDEIEAGDEWSDAHMTFVSDSDFDGLSIDALTALGRRAHQGYMFVVDRVTLAYLEHPVLLLDLGDEPESSFRVVPRMVASIDDNLSIANMNWSDFAENAGTDGVFRGFPDV